MILILKILFRVVGYGLVIAAIWYTPYRLSRLLGLRRSWPLCTVTAIFVILAIAGMIAAGLGYTRLSNYLLDNLQFSAVGFGILFLKVVNIVCGNQFDTILFCKAHQYVVNMIFFR